MNKSILKKLPSLLAILVVVGWVQTFTSCSSDDDGGDTPSSSSVGTQNGGGVSSSSLQTQGGGSSSSVTVQRSSSSSAIQCLDTGSGTFTDSRDNREYKYVTICTQIWMAENLNYEAEGSICYGEGGYKDFFDIVLSDAEIQANCDKYGRLYNWATAMKLPLSCNEDINCADQIASPHQGVCPSGWHLPSDQEWRTLILYVPGGRTTGGTKLKATSGWGWDGLSGGTDDYGFSALPGNYFTYESDYSPNGNVKLPDRDVGVWWSATTEYQSYYEEYRTYDWYISGSSGNTGNYGLKRPDFLSIRCIKD